MFVGYALDHDGDCYRMYNPQTNRVVVTRGIICMRRMIYQGPTPPHPDENLNEEGLMFVLDGFVATGNDSNRVTVLNEDEDVQSIDPDDELQEDSSIDDPNNQFDAGPGAYSEDSVDEVEVDEPNH